MKHFQGPPDPKFWVLSLPGQKNVLKRVRIFFLIFQRSWAFKDFLGTKKNALKDHSGQERFSRTS